MAEAFAAAGVVLLGPRGLEQQTGAAGWWVLRGDLAGREPSVAVLPPVTAAWGAELASVEVSAAGGRIVASEFEVNRPGFAEESPDQKEFSGLEGIPDLGTVAGLQSLG